MRQTEYTREELTREAQSAVKRQGKFLRWTLNLTTTPEGQTFPRLKVYYLSTISKTVETLHVAI